MLPAHNSKTNQKHEEKKEAPPPSHNFKTKTNNLDKKSTVSKEIIKNTEMSKEKLFELEGDPPKHPVTFEGSALIHFSEVLSMIIYYLYDICATILFIRYIYRFTT